MFTRGVMVATPIFIEMGFFFTGFFAAKQTLMQQSVVHCGICHLFIMTSI